MFPVHSYTNPVKKTLKKPLDCVDSNEHTVLLLKKLNTTSVLSSLKVTQVRGQDFTMSTHSVVYDDPWSHDQQLLTQPIK